ncbi:hypothetical protein A3A67_03270 [Candidatus Peribacteria bacterium RIFCSPLOWO2_01_FULL_51_18]|nr:MAG: hypothetical protein A3C52_01015 [Candidatus Peribacteria bacterium RIFCSPHIGHO2_02_FULL_51_15]OGJ66454.1 MAG: hypothetical protein A3A67_03270 [Candidatus Peribacteria bacterium RIFCSPLOWO2_01_FULL_51_18]OGJ68203.1 MAG: hypothetical protein A3J34_00610 [Candidatus Peribacteria bacterium RIFCSPLOWO2_02_FULL_51_10]
MINRFEEDRPFTQGFRDHPSCKFQKIYPLSGEVPDGTGSTTRFGKVKSSFVSEAGATELLVSTGIGDICLQVQGAVAKDLPPGTDLVLNRTSVVPKSDDFS